jgi:hypothetical protein
VAARSLKATKNKKKKKMKHSYTSFELILRVGSGFGDEEGKLNQGKS